MNTTKADAMYDKVFLTLDCTECSGCGQRPDLLWAWDHVSKIAIVQDAAVAARTFTQTAVEHLHSAGWRMNGEALFCPDCAAQDAGSGPD